MEQIPALENRGEIIQFRRADTENLHLEYRLFETTFCRDRRHIYSIAVSVDGPADTDRDEICVCDVTRVRKRALSLFRLICEGLVTPCTLLDVLEDLL